MRGMRGLWVAVRPLYLAGGLVLYAIGAAVGEGTPDTLALALGALVVVLVHVITHYVNDAEDVATDARSEPTALTGGSRAIQRGLVTPGRLLFVSAWLAAAVVAVAAFEAVRGDWLSAALHLAILVLGYAYSGRPFMLGRRGLSELDAAIVMGVLVPLSAAHAAGGIGRAAWAVALVLFVETIFARLCTAFPDLEADRATGKWTIPALLGVRGTAITFALVAALVVVAGVLVAPHLPRPPVQIGRALVVACTALFAAAAVLTGAASRHRLTAPVIGVLGYGVTQVVLLATALSS